MVCKNCGKEFKNVRSLAIHLAKKHKDVIIKEYYDEHFKKENECSCYFCGNETPFINLTKGYNRICNSNECFSKTLATGTYEFLMYKYGYTEEEAKTEQLKRATSRGKKIKKGLDKELEKNPNFHKEKSIQCEEYWIKRGYTKSDAEKYAKEKQNLIIEKTIRKRHTHPELYTNILPTQLGYWIKKGCSEEDAIKLRSKRQSTFSLDKCVEKYGKEEGIKRFNKRQKKWQKSLNENGNLKHGYSKASQDLFYKILNYYEHKDKEDIFFSTKNKEFNLPRTTGGIWIYDYTDIKNKKIIEYNGDEYHANPKYFKENDISHPFRKQYVAKEIWEKDRIKTETANINGFEVLTVWDSDYRKNKDNVLQECLKFLKLV